MYNSIIKDFIFKFVYKLKKDDIFALGYQLAYSLLLSFFPFLIFLFTMAGFSSIKGNDALITLKAILPYGTYNLISNTIMEIFDSKNSNLLSFSFIITIWIASNGFNAVITALNKAYEFKETRSFVKRKILSIFFTFFISFLIIFSIFILVLGDIIGNKINMFFNIPSEYHFIWDFLRYFLTLVFMTLIFSFIYKITPCKKLKFLEVLPGSCFATIGWITASLGFSFYVNNFANYSRLYGSIGAVIILMIWLFLTSLIILIGGELNSLIFDCH